MGTFSQEGICDRQTVPSVSSISRLLRGKSKGEEDGDEETEFSAYAKERKYKVTQALSQSDLEDLIVGFGFETFISGIDTSGGTFSTTTYYLARHQELQDQVYQEIEVCLILESIYMYYCTTCPS